jgi:D-sedoheptulose 7-phosphate isomerase
VEHSEKYLEDLRTALDGLDLQAVGQVREMLAQARREGRQIFVCGNGGSASTASHLANDLGKGASLGRDKPFRVMALTDNVPWITALANDVGYGAVFVEQLRTLAQAGDLLLAISGSGNSPNVLRAVQLAREKGMKTIGWTGMGGGKLAGMVDLPIVVKSQHMGRVEDVHVVLMHLVCYYFMEQ